MRKSILLLIFFNVNLVAYNQVIKGTIFDIKTKNAIYSAAVYFNGTSVGTLSDENGNFMLDISNLMELYGKEKLQDIVLLTCYPMIIQPKNNGIWILPHQASSFTWKKTMHNSVGTNCLCQPG